MIELRSHQAAAVEMLRSSLARGKRRPLVQAPTGFGKTPVAAAAGERDLAKGGAYHRYVERFGVAPCGEVHRAILRLPTPKTLSWIRSRQIRSAKRREALRAVA